MKKKQQLVIVLPAELAELPVRIVRGSGCRELIFSLQPTCEDANYEGRTEKKYMLIWRQNDYLKVSADEILWIEAGGSYSTIHLTQKRSMTISFHLAIVEESLPQTDFMRIHRSYIVNLRCVESLVGNSLRIGDTLLTVGREYREQLLDRFVFLGVRRKKK